MTSTDAIDTDFGQRCTATARDTEAAIRRDERRRVATLIKGDADVIGRYAVTPEAAVLLTVAIIEAGTQ